jgi:hypothetical protein
MEEQVLKGVFSCKVVHEVLLLQTQHKLQQTNADTLNLQACLIPIVKTT